MEMLAFFSIQRREEESQIEEMSPQPELSTNREVWEEEEELKKLPDSLFNSTLFWSSLFQGIDFPTSCKFCGSFTTV